MSEELDFTPPETPVLEYTPMPDSLAQEDKRKTFSGDADGLRSAAAELAEERSAKAAAPPTTDEDGILTRNYQFLSGERAGEEIPENQTITAERAARDVTMMREYEAALQQPQQAEIAQAIDNVRNEFSANPQPQAQPDQAQAQPRQPTPPEPAQPVDGVHPDVVAALQNAHVREALSKEVASVEAARAQYAQATWQAAQLAAGSLLSQFPELAQFSSAQLPTAIQAIAQTDPAKAAKIQAHIGQVQNLYQASQQAQQQAQQLQAQNLAAWTKAESDKFDREVFSKENPETLQKIKSALPEIIEKDYGISSADLAQAWQHNPALRSSAMQSVILDAVKYRLAQREAATKVSRPVPLVQRPGVSVGRNANDDAIESALKAFRESPTPAAGARLLQARRGSR